MRQSSSVGDAPVDMMPAKLFIILYSTWGEQVVLGAPTTATPSLSSDSPNTM